jgi:hypothetical protein
MRKVTFSQGLSNMKTQTNILAPSELADAPNCGPSVCEICSCGRTGSWNTEGVAMCSGVIVPLTDGYRKEQV